MFKKDRDSETKEADTDKQRSAILTLFSPALCIYIQSLTSLFPQREVLNRLPPRGPFSPASQVVPNTAPTLTWSWLQLTDRDCPLLRVGTCVYIIFNANVSGSDSLDLLPLVNSRQLFNKLEHPISEILDWWIFEQSAGREHSLFSVCLWTLSIF